MSLMKNEVAINWLIRRDMEQVLDIENRSFEFPWSESDFLSCLRQRNCIGMVAREQDESLEKSIAGYMVYELHKQRIQLLNFAVSPERRRAGVGRAMVSKLYGKLSFDRRNRVLTQVRESNLTAQLFFRANGFRAIEVIREFYCETLEDAYVFQYRCGGDSQASSKSRYAN